MKRLLLLYYTGTYNTRLLAKEIAKSLSDEYEVTSIEIDSKTEAVSLSDYDAIGLGYPIYAFNAPSFFIKYLKKLKFDPSKSYFIFKDSGESFRMNNASSRRIIKLFKKNRIKDYSEYHFLLPYNIHFKFADAFVYQLIQEDKKLLTVLKSDLKTGTNRHLKSNIFYNIASKILRIQTFGGYLNSFFYKVDKKKCIDCNLCINSCPVGNIYRKKGKIKFKHHCLMCMRCSFYCPKDAISIGLLNSWRVNGAYNFKNILNNDSLKDIDYVSKQKDFFYKCYPATFKHIDEMYNEITKENEK